MEWSKFPDAVQVRVLLAAVAAPSDVANLRTLERRAAHLVSSDAWAEAVAFAHLGSGMCNLLTCVTSGAFDADGTRVSAKKASLGPDWPLVLRSAAAGRFRCVTAPEGIKAEAKQGDRSGHAATVLRGAVLVIVGGARMDQGQAPPWQLSPPETRVASIDLKRGRWIEVSESVVDGSTTFPSHPRVRPSLTALGYDRATLVGGMSIGARSFRDVWTLCCEIGAKEEDSILRCSWQELAPKGPRFPARSCHVAVSTPCGLVVVGGVGDDGHVLPCEAYCLGTDPVSGGDEWRLPQQSGLFPPQGALHHGCYHRGRLFLVGGVDDAGLQRRGYHMTDVHLLDLGSWVWERLGRHELTPSLHSRAAPLLLGHKLLLVGGDAGGNTAKSDHVAVLNLERSLDLKPCGGREAFWMTGSVEGVAFAAAGHTVIGGVLLGGIERTDAAAPVALLLPDVAPPIPKAKARQLPRWFKS
eukprot:TRINITY_DN42434_c0_g1_i1.p1 TRINITY_DN42434_c0_g1~~TRINITY_DN42434_c0_g1_i1.p1  ORF type:complete len:469 (-),score=56.70 TRINITY_DN42434_c0_g1_i1:86-1492(-)